MYRERPSALPGAVLWWRRVPATGSTARVLPDGCLDLIWYDDELLVAGPDSVAQTAVSRPHARYAAVRFPPGVGPAVLRVPAHELRDRRVPLADLWPATRVRRLAARIAAPPDGSAGPESAGSDRWAGPESAGGVVAALEAALAAQWTQPDRVVAGIAAGVRAGLPVARIAETVGLSERQLHRRCLPAFGYGPKTLARILRMQRAVAAARAGVPFARVAVDTGYADQAHLAREVRALAGVPLGTLVRG